MAKRKLDSRGLVWVSTVCGKRQSLVTEDEDYGLGEWEKCLCGDLQCRAVVERKAKKAKVK